MDRLDELGLCAWNAFYAERQRLYGLTDGKKSYFTNDPNKHHKFYKAFRTIATMCLNRDVNAHDYIVTCFSLVVKNHKYVTPRDFASVPMLEAYIAHKKAYGDDASQAWMSQSRDLADIAGRLVPELYTSIEEILGDRKLPFASWFRIFFLQEVNPGILGLFGQQAWSELQADKRLRVFLRTTRPGSMQVLENRCGYFGDLPEGPADSSCVAEVPRG